MLNEMNRQDSEEYAVLTLDEQIGPMGDCTANFEDQIINVFGGIPGEEVQVRIVRYRRRRKQMISGIVTEALKPSQHRVDPPCPHFGKCTGCQWEHIDYAYQLALKREYVVRELGMYPSLREVSVDETIGAPELYGYRNHARFTVRKSGTPGFVNRITRQFVEIDRCLLMTAGINRLLGKLAGRAQETSQLSIRYGVNTDQWLVQPKLDSTEISFDSGQTHYSELLSNHMFKIGSPSFFQVNTSQAEVLGSLVRESLVLRGDETIVDAYAGVGTFAILLADSASRIIAIEESDSAVKDAKINAEGIHNIEFQLGKTEEVLRTLNTRPDAVVLDPPRSGCHPATIDEVLRWLPDRTVYVSCDPAALGRDLDILVRGGLQVQTISPIDMFPQTHHVETLAVLAPPV